MTTFICFSPTAVFGGRGLTLNVAQIMDIVPAFNDKDECYIYLSGDENARRIKLPYDAVLRALKTDDIVGIKLIKV